MRGRYVERECASCKGRGTLTVTDTKPPEKGGRGLGVFKRNGDLWVFQVQCHVCRGRGCSVSVNEGAAVIGYSGDGG